MRSFLLSCFVSWECIVESELQKCGWKNAESEYCSMKNVVMFCARNRAPRTFSLSAIFRILWERILSHFCSFSPDAPRHSLHSLLLSVVKTKLQLTSAFHFVYVTSTFVVCTQNQSYNVDYVRYCIYLWKKCQMLLSNKDR